MLLQYQGYTAGKLSLKMEEENGRTSKVLTLPLLLGKHGRETPEKSGKYQGHDASVETFFKYLKAELIWRQKWSTRRPAETAIFQYINGFYNTRRRHSYLGGISPLAFEAKVA